MAADSTCGACDTRATQRSCSAALTWAGSAPQTRARASIAASPADRTGGSGQITQGRPRNRSARAAAGPERSRPDSGCPGTNEAMSQPAVRACLTGSDFTLATSVYQRASPAAWARARAGATACGGTASTTTSAGPPAGGPPGRRPPGPATGKYSARPDVGGQPGRRRIRVGEPDGHALGPQRERHRGPDQPGPDDDHAGRCGLGWGSRGARLTGGA